MMKTTKNEEKIRRTSKRLRRIFQIAAFALPFFPALFWLFYNDLPLVMQQHTFAGRTETWLPLNSRIIALAGNIPATILAVLALVGLKRLFALYEQGCYFQAENVRLFRALGRLAVWSVLADVVNNTVLEIARTINNPPGERLLSIGFSSDHAKLLLVAAIIMLIGMVIDEARKIHEEHQLTV
ncbi:MAG: DUF2975 domain-containing protein [Pseudomonadota bacterium]